jgi:hypothetical protein
MNYRSYSRLLRHRSYSHLARIRYRSYSRSAPQVRLDWEESEPAPPPTDQAQRGAASTGSLASGSREPQAEATRASSLDRSDQHKGPAPRPAPARDTRPDGPWSLWDIYRDSEGGGGAAAAAPWALGWTTGGWAGPPPAPPARIAGAAPMTRLCLVDPADLCFCSYERDSSYGPEPSPETPPPPPPPRAASAGPAPPGL